MIRNLFKSLQRDERGVSALEYAILAGVIVVVIVAGLTTLKGNVSTLFEKANTAISDAVK